MEIQKSKGIILSSKVINEADIISSIYTQEFGLRNFIFKGLKKSKRRSKTATRAGVMVNIVYYYSDNKNFLVVNNVDIESFYPKLYEDLDKIYNLSFILEFTQKTVGLNHQDLKIYNLLKSAITVLSETTNSFHLTLFFIIHLLKIEGIVYETSSLSNKEMEFINSSYEIKFKNLQFENFSKDEIQNLIYFFINFIENYLNTNLKTKQFILQNN